MHTGPRADRGVQRGPSGPINVKWEIFASTEDEKCKMRDIWVFCKTGLADNCFKEMSGFSDTLKKLISSDDEKCKMRDIWVFCRAGG